MNLLKIGSITAILVLSLQANNLDECKEVSKYHEAKEDIKKIIEVCKKVDSVVGKGYVARAKYYLNNKKMQSYYIWIL